MSISVSSNPPVNRTIHAMADPGSRVTWRPRQYQGASRHRWGGKPNGRQRCRLRTRRFGMAHSNIRIARIR
ncbi:Uncharacterised protein [Mycobacterium tuberculosis]|uniref:Uncharacterized protein n=1 Tax=Mycobacterium tuberculosis TaxID=1773 RepID=A0A0U0QNR0_MYCTX|nr:Uncharacterised protein [Mycobacterium tuberculosis]SGO53044.1 Uncharacterised protein [Mycobacterium tuberculosis]